MVMMCGKKGRGREMSASAAHPGGVDNVLSVLHDLARAGEDLLEGELENMHRRSANFRFRARSLGSERRGRVCGNVGRFSCDRYEQWGWPGTRAEGAVKRAYQGCIRVGCAEEPVEDGERVDPERREPADNPCRKRWGGESQGAGAKAGVQEHLRTETGALRTALPIPDHHRESIVAVCVVEPFPLS